MRKITKTIATLFVCAVLIAGGAVFGPRLYGLLFGGANARWVSERFSEQLEKKRELIVLEKTITGQETVSTDAWLIGTVQRVTVPYTFTASFTVNMRQAAVRFDGETQTIQVTLPAPQISHWKLTVDEETVEVSDLLYPLTPGRYAEIKQEMEQKLADEVTADAELRETAWAAAVSETQAMYRELLAGEDAAYALQITQAQPENENENGLP